MIIKFFNTLTRKKETFIPLVSGKVNIYSCGPTVYDYVHIGNLTSFLFADILRRWLEFIGFKVKHVMNLTDVDDKTIKAARDEQVGLSVITNRYAKAFFDDLEKLNVKPATIYPKATEHIPEMVSLIKILLQKGNAYKGSDGSIYFKISSFPTYGELANLDRRSEKVGASGSAIYSEAKSDVQDFVLWKAWKEEDGDVFWDTEIGRGRPGWHIECSAMSMKHLGETFDIHTGGIDLIFPHHQNEIAQSESATGKRFVNYWLHHEFLKLGGEGKMSKSAGGIKKLKDIASTTDDALGFRYLRFTTHYRTPLTFTDDSLEFAKNSVRRLKKFRSKLVNITGVESVGNEEEIKTLIDQTQTGFIEKMSDDLNTPQAVAVFYDFVNEIEGRVSDSCLSTESAKECIGFTDKIDSILGVIGDTPETSATITPEQKNLIKERETARKNKDWKKADQIRTTLSDQGIILEDTATGTKWRSST